MKNRDSNLDLLRASAIMMVVFYHIFQRWGDRFPLLASITHFGLYGVDLFFVLSGWLIGGLLWDEEQRFGNVEIFRFIFRRALRTMPPYFVALAISYLGVFVARHEPFSFRYLIFIQNYSLRIPFFLISWSLCIEEHFYLIMPMIVLPFVRYFHRSYIALVVLVFLPLVFRALIIDFPLEQQFGFYTTATHLRFEGLLLGVLAALLRSKGYRIWYILRGFAVWGFMMFILITILIMHLPQQLQYIFTYTTVDLTFFFLLVSVADKKSLPFASSKLIYLIAITSYSIYLTHAIVLNALFPLIQKLKGFPSLELLLIICIMLIAGGLFYLFIEVPSLAIRKRYMPHRKKLISN